MTTMRIGITTLATCRGMSPARLAREVEDRGFDALHLPEHSHIPVSRRSPFPGASPKLPDLPDAYWHLNGLMASMAMAAAVTDRITIGSSVVLVAQHDPIWMAKELATIDHHSGGRVELGVGFGWNREEFENHGHQWATRRERAKDCVGVMRALWTDHVAGYDGSTMALEPSWSYPKTVAEGGPPILLGGVLKPLMLSHLVDWADGWMPILTADLDLGSELELLRHAFEAAGRDPRAIHVTAMNAPKTPDGLAQLAELGVTTAAITIWAEDPDRFCRELDQVAELLG